MAAVRLTCGLGLYDDFVDIHCRRGGPDFRCCFVAKPGRLGFDGARVVVAIPEGNRDELASGAVG
jgi:hypothetical protein